MKKRYTFLFGLILIFVLLLLVKAQDNSMPGGIPAGQIGDNADKITNAVDNLSNNETRGEYLKQEWTKILEKTTLGKFFLGISNVLKVFSPVFKIFIGVDYSLSWYFYLCLFIWIFVVCFIYNSIKNLLQLKVILSLFISIIVPAIAAQINTFGMIADFIIKILTKPWMLYIAIAFGFLAGFVYYLIMKSLGDYIKKSKKEDEEARREHKQKALETAADIKLKAQGLNN